MTHANAIHISKDKLIEAINSSSTMGGAAKILEVDWRTFKKSAEKYGLYTPAKYRSAVKYNITDIFAGNHPQYPTSHLSKRLVKEGYKNYICESCGISTYNGKLISLELNHKDGNNSNHSLINLELICPNCHSQTDTYRSKNIKKKKGSVSESG